MGDGHVTAWLQTLGLEAGATFGDVQAAYRDLAKVWHPDRFPNDDRLREKAGEELKAINDAFGNLRRYLEDGGQLPALDAAPAERVMHGKVPVRKRDPRRDTWTIRPPLQMPTEPARDRRRARRIFAWIVGVVGVGGLVGFLVWLWPLWRSFLTG